MTIIQNLTWECFSLNSFQTDSLFVVALNAISSGKIRLIKSGESVDKISLDELRKFF